MEFKLKTALMCVAFAFCAFSAVIDVYDFTMRLKIPRVYSNTQSLGYRKLQTQKITGQIHVRYTDGELPEIIVTNLVNHTHKINGSSIRYQCYKDEYAISRFNYIGNNRKNVFIKPGLSFSFIADPSYNIGAIEEDNSLYLQLAGYGTSSAKKFAGNRIPSKLRGNVTGNLGCGCTEYGHKSPTRVIGWYGFTDYVDDVAPVYGSWTMKIKSRYLD